MTREECMEALKSIELNYDAEYVNECCDEFCMKMKSYIITLEQLIKEHFDNPPLSFDDLKEGMWVYDNIYKSVYSIKKISKNKKIKVYTYGWIGEFEENRFFPVQMANRGE